MRAVVTQDPRVIEDARALVLPGDGAFHDAMANLQSLGLLEPAPAALDEGRPFLGICLGYQLLFTESEEFGQGKGLDVIPGVVRRFPSGLKVPHMGWNYGGARRRPRRCSTACPSGAHFYFVHSYYPAITDASLAGGDVHLRGDLSRGGGSGVALRHAVSSREEPALGRAHSREFRRVRAGRTNLMLIIPAIDLRAGRCVRLLQGRAEAETVFSDDPVAMARRWQSEGAPRLHVVDLDGAFGGGPAQTAIIRDIARRRLHPRRSRRRPAPT